MIWHVLGIAGFIIWAAGGALAVFYIVAGYVIFHDEDDLHLSVGFAVRAVLLVACWPAFLAQHATTARGQSWV